MTSRESPIAWHDVTLIDGFFNKKLYSYAIIRSNCSAVIFDRKVLDEYAKAPAKSSCEIAEVCASMTAAIAVDSSSAHPASGRVDVGAGRVVVGCAGTAVVEGTAVVGAVCVSLEEHAPSISVHVIKMRRCRRGDVNMGLPNRTYMPVAAYANGVAFDFTAHQQQLDSEGYTIVRDAIDLELVNALRDDVQRLQAELQRTPANNRFEGSHTTRTYNLLAHSEIWQQVPVHDSVLPLIEYVLGNECLISSLASIAIGPGEAAQVLHADDQVQPLAKPHIATVCNSMWALTDFTEENGATRLVPGSHQWQNPDYKNGEPEAATIPAEMPRGSVLIWHGSLWHGGGANTTTNETRVGVAMNYCAGFIRQQENVQLGIPPEVMRTFSPQLRELCGLGVYRGLTGNIDKRSPAEVFYGDPPARQIWDNDPTGGN